MKKVDPLQPALIVINGADYGAAILVDEGVDGIAIGGDAAEVDGPTGFEVEVDANGPIGGAGFFEALIQCRDGQGVAGGDDSGPTGNLHAS